VGKGTGGARIQDHHDEGSLNQKEWDAESSPLIEGRAPGAAGPRFVLSELLSRRPR
jgi:hypothetical protein